MSAEIIPFPERPKVPEPSALVHLTWTGIELGEQICTASIHYFTSREARCQCGQETWPGSKPKRRFFRR